MSIYDSLNPEQRRAVEHDRGPMLILAGAGSGKTRVLTHRIAYLIEERNVNPYQIMALTFTNKAAKEMRERVDKIVGYGAENIWVSTFHSTCVRILRRFIETLGYDRNFTIYDTDDQKTLIREVLKFLQIDTKQTKERVFLSAISSAKDEGISPEEFELSALGDYNKMKISNVYKEYQRRLKTNNALDFDDLIMKTVELFQSNTEALNYYRNRFRYIMVDEYQDTNTIQFKLIRLLAHSLNEYNEVEHNLCVVGDDDQSIYKFRGANIRNILDFEKEFPDAVVIKLEQNYRSTKNILNAANEVIHNNLGRKDKSLWTDNEDGEQVSFCQYDTDFAEATQVVDSIKTLNDQDGISFNNFAILYRTNAQSRVFEEKMIQRSVPYKIIGSINFYQRKEIKDLLAYLKTIDNGLDGIAVKRIINVPKRGIGLTTLDRVEEFSVKNNMSFYDALRHAENIPGLGRSTSKITSFVSFIETIKSKLSSDTFTLKDLMEEILEGTGYLKELEEADDESAEDRIGNINELINKIVTYEVEATEPPTLSGFLEEVALVADIDSLEEDSNHVVLMTLHSAKGLEFPYVYLCGMEDGIFPSYMSINAENPELEIEEERRLCYVGITRAMKQIHLSAARQRMMRGETQFNRPSRFINEIPRYLLTIQSAQNKGYLAKDSYGESPIRNASPNFSTQSRGMFDSDNPFDKSSSYNDTMFDKATPSMRGTTGINSMPSFSGQAKTARGFQPSVGGTLPTKNFGNSNLGTLAYGVGDTVKHIKFGQGVVTNLTKGGRDYEVTVDFGEQGIKKMLSSFAKLEKIED
ncbi:ATP-dependent helicase [Lachnoclostridium phytofermentans]|uniref:ATP-dependent DNA helicase PcrA n=1 Tax=Lachnoclostridium phytofermentans (strain ATCC 700394 / DSM 18823 / ISDg) TaxID=357809 RepID=A9KP66_LACP7|nr:UvrD-helicase domain-containing protein [Lachnoclostridium phytofermentans]ABX41728.1 UvrD/REP helicase [Lachnoclostridium phytofermentans ISDg]